MRQTHVLHIGITESMPHITVQLLAGTSKEQKRQLIRGITGVLVETLGKKPESVVVVISETDEDSWGVAGDSVASHRGPFGRK
jgi:4-oxalocrotonate tautomerase